MIERVARGLGLRSSYRAQGGIRGVRTWFDDSSLGTDAVGGDSVTIEQSIGIAAVYACIRLIAESLGSTPLIPYRDIDGSRERLRDSTQWTLLHDEPNPSMSPVDLWTLLTTWLVGWGDAFVGKQFAPNGELMALWPIHPRDVAVGLQKGQPVYQVRQENGLTYTTDRSEVIHLMGQSFDGKRGVSPLYIARSELSTAMQASKYAAAVYRNTGVPRGALMVQEELTDEASARLRGDWMRVYGGSANAGKVAILEEGVEFKPISMPMKDVQFVEQQQLSIQQIARIFRVPLSMIQADSPGGLTYRTAETENLQFLTHTLRPWFVRVEQALNRDTDLFQLDVDFCEFLPDAMLKVTTAERFAAYSTALAGKPWMLQTEVRKAENLPDDPKIEEQIAAASAPPPAPAPAQPAPAPAPAAPAKP